MPALSEIPALYLQGVPLKQIARKYSKGTAAIRAVLDEAGVPMRKQGSPVTTPGIQAEMVALCKQGWSHEKIAEKLGVSKYTVHYQVKKVLGRQPKGPRVHLDAQGNKFCKGCQRFLPPSHYQADSSLTTRTRGLCRECTRFKHRKRSYGISKVEYDAMFSRQHGACAICKVPHAPTAARPDLCVDHDHATGLVRKLCCHRCNLVLGLCRDSPDLLRACATYLETDHAPSP